MMFPVICTFLDKTIGYLRDKKPMDVTILSSDLTAAVHGKRWSSQGSFNKWMALLMKYREDLKEKAVYWFEGQGESGLFTIKL